MQAIRKIAGATLNLVRRMIRLLITPFARLWQRTGVDTSTPARLRTAAAPRWRKLIRLLVLAAGLVIFVGLELALAYGINSGATQFVITILITGVFLVSLSVWPTHMFILWLVLSPIAALLFRLDFGTDLPAITFDRVMIYSLAALLLLRQLRAREKSEPLKFGEYLVLAFPMYLVASVPFVEHTSIPNVMVQIAARSGDLVVMYFVARLIICEPKHVRWLISAIIVMAIYNAALGVADQMLGKWTLFELIGYRISLLWAGGSEAGRSSGAFNNPFDLAVLLGLAIMFALHSMNWDSRRWMRIVCALSLPVMFAAWWFTYSRSTYVGLIFAMCLMPFISSRRKRYGVLLSVAVVVALIWLPVQLANSKIGDRFRNPENVKARIITDAAMWNMFKQHPVFGMGLGNVKGHMGQYAQSVLGIAGYEVYTGIGTWPNRFKRADQLSPHNTQITLLAEHGTLGAMIYFGSLLALFVYMWRARKSVSPDGLLGRDLISIIMCMYLAFFVFACSAGFYDGTRFSMIFAWLFAAVAVRLPHIVGQQQAVEKQLRHLSRSK